MVTLLDKAKGKQNKTNKKKGNLRPISFPIRYFFFFSFYFAAYWFLHHSIIPYDKSKVIFIGPGLYTYGRLL